LASAVCSSEAQAIGSTAPSTWPCRREGLLVDERVPGQVGRSPFHWPRLGLLVELVELGTESLLVVPREDRGALVLDGPEAGLILTADEVEDRLEVIDVVSADDVEIRRHLVVVKRGHGVP
jgi:hypothetical protein